MNTEKTYEMLWDCPFCGARGLLGLTHRHCPNCGAPQDPSKRYFPPENQKIAVQDHRYAGADVVCPACQAANGRAANNCGLCGSPLAGGRSVQAQQQQVIPDYSGARMPPPAAQAVPQKGGGVAKYLIGCVLIVGVLVLVSVFGFCVCNSLLAKESTFEVTNHVWSHRISIESYKLEKATSPCSKMPSSAERVSREKQDPDCATTKTDQGDGTYKEERTCKDREDVCTYYVGKWSHRRYVESAGVGQTDRMPWPVVQLSRTGTCEGCEREGAKIATYTVRFKESESGSEKTCDFDDVHKWGQFRVGSVWKGKVGGLLGGIDCGSLEAR